MSILPAFAAISFFLVVVTGETNYTYGVDVVCILVLIVRDRNHDAI